MSFSFVSQVCLAVIVSVFGVALSAPLDGQQQTVAIEGGAKRQEKRGIGLTYTGLTGFGAYDTSLGLAGYPATAYVTPTVIKSTYTVPAAGKGNGVLGWAKVFACFIFQMGCFLHLFPPT